MSEKINNPATKQQLIVRYKLNAASLRFLEELGEQAEVLNAKALTCTPKGYDDAFVMRWCEMGRSWRDYCKQTERVDDRVALEVDRLPTDGMGRVQLMQSLVQVPSRARELYLSSKSGLPLIEADC